MRYGDAARRIIASSSPQLHWLAPHSAPDRTGLAAQGAPSPDHQRLNEMLLGLDAVRQSVDRIAITQEQTTRDVDQLTAGQKQMARNVDQLTDSQERMTHNVDQLTAGQEQMTREITKLQAVEQQVLQKNSEPPPRSAPALARNPVPRSLAPMVR